jgi:hypothetical protein
MKELYVELVTVLPSPKLMALSDQTVLRCGGALRTGACVKEFPTIKAKQCTQARLSTTSRPGDARNDKTAHAGRCGVEKAGVEKRSTESCYWSAVPRQ